MNSPAKSFGNMKNMPMQGGGLSLHGMGGADMMIKENVKPPKSNFTFQVIDYEKPAEATAQFANKNNSSHIQIGVMDPGSFNKDSEQNREIDMNELNALLL